MTSRNGTGGCDTTPDRGLCRARQRRGDGVASSVDPDPPGAGEQHVDRPSVGELLERAVARKVCVVIGAAGWGKTTAVAVWSRNHPTAWLRYEDYEGDAPRLLACLLRAFRAHLPVPAPRDGTAAVDTEEVVSSVATMCGWLHDVLSEDLILVLDDLHWL